MRTGSKTITVRPGKPASGSRTLGEREFSREMLRAHNDVRAGAGLPPLQWSSALAASAQQWAASLVANNRTAHNAKTPYGENILATGLGSTPTSVVTEWASESLAYTYRTNTCNGDCGHYTQVVWRNTRRVGCAMARNSQREIWVCSYDPPGNFRGEWPY